MGPQSRNCQREDMSKLAQNRPPQLPLQPVVSCKAAATTHSWKWKSQNSILYLNRTFLLKIVRGFPAALVEEWEWVSDPLSPETLCVCAFWGVRRPVIFIIFSKGSMISV